MNPKTLRPYQARLVTDVCRAPGDVLIEQPTGSGKTMQIVTLVAMQLGQRFTHAILSAPQEQIEHGFVHRDYQRVDWAAHAGVAVPSVKVPEEIILASRKSDLGSVRQIRSYLRLPGPLEHALACTHAALNRLTAEDLPDDLSGQALFLDEAHHASADGLSQVVSVWRERGGQLYFFTATPYRGDGRRVALEGMRLLRRSLAEHMAEGFAPGHLDSEIVALGRPGDSITAGQFTGEDAPPPSYLDGLVEAITRKWQDDGKPKAIVRVPPMRGGSEGLVGSLIHALSSKGARVLNATGTGTEDKQRFLNALESEKCRTFAESSHDVIVGIQRVMEGTDWPVCSAVYCVGMPGSLNTVVQLLGRAMRPKGDGHPLAHRDRARLVFLVPCGGGSALADLSLDHSRHALLTCCFLADHEVGQEWIVLREIRRGIEDALGPPGENPVAADAENEANVAIDPEVRAEVELAMASAHEQIISEDGEPILGEVVQAAAKSRPDLPEAAIQRVATEVLAAQPSSTGDRARDAIHTEVARKLRIDPRVKKAMEEVFAVVLNEFRDVTLKDSAVLERVRRQVHGVTGGQMREFAQRLRDAAPRPLTEEQILAWADAHYERTGKWPQSELAGSVLDTPGETWKAIQMALWKGLRGLPGGSSLARLLEEKRGVPNSSNPPRLTEKQILDWADSLFREKGIWPRQTSGWVQDVPGLQWSTVDNALIKGYRGLPGDSSLAKLLESERGVRNQGQLPSLTVEQILSWADTHHERTGKWPKQKSGPIINVPDETWLRVHNALNRGLRGFPGGSSLAQLLATERGVRNHLNVADLSIAQILLWADEHHERTGNWPNAKSGPVTISPGETWAALDIALGRGTRGLPGSSSVAKLLAEHRGIRNKQNLIKLSEDRILAWADAHHQRTGEWPKASSGELADAPGETWSRINRALISGLRGLIGGSSLPQLLSLHRGVRNSANVPDLTEEQILAWADAHRECTGMWPGQNSGLIGDAPGETWLAIDIALRQGCRNLSGGSSLARLLAQHRGVRNKKGLPSLTLEQILDWVDAHRQQTGRWPQANSGPIKDAPGETWMGVNTALNQGNRGLTGGSSLLRLIKEHRSTATS